MKILINISYIGGNYHGFQAQKTGPTVQSKLNEAAKRLFGFDCNITGCSRTDSGVHALEFCITIEPSDENLRHKSNWCKVPVEKFPRAFNMYLPLDIAVSNAVWVNDDFHPRYDVEYKEYTYKIFDSLHRNPFFEGRSYRYGYEISENSVIDMNEAAQIFVGKHNFSTFMAHGSKITNTIREVKYAEVKRNRECVEFTIAADGFLYNMVRIMAGTLLEVERRKIKVEDVKMIIASQHRDKAGITAPPEGLYLTKVRYPENDIIWCKK